MIRFSETEWIERMDQLSQVEYMVVDDFISEELFRTITDYFDRLMQKDRFSKAGIGEAGNRQVEASVRGDFIYWLDRERDHELTDFFNLIDELINNIRRYCYLSISDFEFISPTTPPAPAMRNTSTSSTSAPTGFYPSWSISTKIGNRKMRESSKYTARIRIS